VAERDAQPELADAMLPETQPAATAELGEAAQQPHLQDQPAEAGQPSHLDEQPAQAAAAAAAGAAFQIVQPPPPLVQVPLTEKAMHPADVPRIARERLVMYLLGQKRKRERCSSLPFAALGFVLAATLLVLHLRHGESHSLTAAVRSSLAAPDATASQGAALQEAAAWSWLRSRPDGQPVAMGVRVVGGIRFSRLPVGESEEPLTLCESTAWHFVWDSLTGSQKSSTPTVCQTTASSDVSWLPWGLQSASVNSIVDGAWDRWVGNNVTEAMQDNGFSAQLLMRSVDSNFYALYNFAMSFDPSGLAITKSHVTAIDAVPVWMHVADDWKDGRGALIIVDSAVILCLVVFSFIEFARIFHLAFCVPCRNRKMTSYWTTEKVLDWTAFVFIALLLGVYSYCLILVDDLNGLLKKLPDVDEQVLRTSSELEQLLTASGSNWQTYTQQLDLIVEQARRITHTQAELLWYGAFLLLCMCGRLCKAMTANPRMDFTVRSISESLWNLMRVLPPASGIVLALALIGYMTFGPSLDLFSTGSNAIAATLLVFRGRALDANFQDMLDKGDVLGILWVWVSQIVLGAFLFSMVLCATVYGRLRAKTQAANGASVPEQLRNIVFQREAKEAAQRMGGSLGELKAAFSKFSEGKLLRQLSDPNVHTSDMVDRDSLAQALSAQGWAEHERLDLIVKAAFAQQQQKVQQGLRLRQLQVHPLLPRSKAMVNVDASEVSDVLRLMACVDANVNNLADILKKVECCLPVAPGMNDLLEALSKEAEKPLAMPVDHDPILEDPRTNIAACDLPIVPLADEAPGQNEEALPWRVMPVGETDGSSNNSKTVGGTTPVPSPVNAQNLVNGLMGDDAVFQALQVSSLVGGPQSCASLDTIPEYGSRPASCTDDFLEEDLSMPPSPPPEEVDEPGQALALGIPMNADEVLTLPGLGDRPRPLPAPIDTRLRPASAGSADALEIDELERPPTAPLDSDPTHLQPLVSQLGSLERSGELRCSRLRELCGNLEFRLVQAAENMEAGVKNQVDRLSKLESTFDQIIKGVGPLFATM